MTDPSADVDTTGGLGTSVATVGQVATTATTGVPCIDFGLASDRRRQEHPLTELYRLSIQGPIEVAGPPDVAGAP